VPGRLLSNISRRAPAIAGSPLRASALRPAHGAFAKNTQLRSAVPGRCGPSRSKHTATIRIMKHTAAEPSAASVCGSRSCPGYRPPFTRTHGHVVGAAQACLAADFALHRDACRSVSLKQCEGKRCACLVLRSPGVTADTSLRSPAHQAPTPSTWPPRSRPRRWRRRQ
jgi:hypothetical protein